MSEQGHDCSLWDTGHRQSARGVMAEIVEAQISQTKITHQAPEGDGESRWVPLGEDERLAIE